MLSHLTKFNTLNTSAMILKYFKAIIALASVLALVTGCKKTADKQPVTYKSFKALEYQTGIPVVGATIDLYKCNKPNSWGCLDATVMEVQ